MNKTKKYIIGISLIVLMLAGAQLFWSCKGDTAEKRELSVLEVVESGKQVRFIGQWQNEGKREKLVRDFVRQYSFQNQEVDVELKFPEEVYYDRSDLFSNQNFVSKIMMESNPEWDIIRLNDQYEAIAQVCGDSLWPKKYFVDFSTIPEFRRNTASHLLSEEVKNRWGGIIPGPFIEGQYWALWSNAEVAKKVGIEVKQYGMTAADFVSYIKAVNTYNTNNPGDYITPLHEANDWQTVFPIFFHLYATALSNNQQFNEISVTEEKLIAWHEALRVFEELAAYNPLNPDWRTVGWNDSRFDLINEQCLFYSNGSWMYNIWNEENDVNTLKCFPNEYPVFDEAKAYPGGYLIMWGVLKNSPNREAAVDFLLAMTTPDIAEMWVQYTKCPTGIKGKLTDVSFGTDQFEGFSNHIQSKYGSNTYRTSEDMSQYALGSASIKTYYREVLLGEISADEAMNKIRNELSGFLAKNE
jgi:hypothetical protein